MRRVLIQFAIAAIVSAALSSGIMYYWFVDKYESANPEQAAQTIIIERGLGVRAIARQLEASELIDDPRLFVLGVKFLAEPGPLRAGEFFIPAAISPRGIVRILQRGDVVAHQITVPEGLTSYEIVQLLNAEEKLSGPTPELPPEGTLLPETYQFHRGNSRAEILARMRQSKVNVLNTLWQARAPDLPISTPEEALILASIVEKETGVADERPRVAGVFINRLRKGMRLQSDPTVIYGITQGREPLGRSLTRADLRAETAHNTYVIPGLPPTPIANAGEASIAAVLNPMETDELYFVADGTGGHAFARTLEEHNRNVRAWRKFRRENP